MLGSVEQDVFRVGAVLLELVGVYSLVHSIRKRAGAATVPWWVWGVHAVALGLVGAGSEGTLQALLIVAGVLFALVGAFTLGVEIKTRPSMLYDWRRSLPGQLSKLDRAYLVRAIREEGDGFALLVSASRSNLDLNFIGESPSPYIEFRFSLHNGSLFPVEITPSAQGHVSCNSKRLSRTPIIECDRQYLEHAWYGQLVVTQWLSPEESDWLQDLQRTRTRTQFSFSDLAIEVRVVGVEDLKPKRLLLNDNQPIDAYW